MIIATVNKTLHVTGPYLGTAIIYIHTYTHIHVYIHIQLIIATVNKTLHVTGPYLGTAIIKLTGTNSKLAAIHGEDPRQTPEILLGMHVCMYVCMYV